MPSVTGNVIVNDAFALLNVYLPGESVSNNDAQLARRMLNDWLGEMAQKALMIPVVARERFDLVANQGSPTNPYTIGDGADFDTEKPSNQNSITFANLILTASSPEVRVPLWLATDAAAWANQVPALTSGQPTSLYYNPTYATTDFGTIELWPVPDVSTNDLELFIQKPLAQFADLSTTYYVPDGVPRMLKYNLASALQVPFGKELSQKAEQAAVNSLGTFRRSNTKLYDAVNDASFTGNAGGVFNIQTYANG